MRSTCQWSCVLQFTWRRAVCCGLHRPMSQVIPCLGLNFHFYFFPLISTVCARGWCHYSIIIAAWVCKLPWRSPLITNNTGMCYHDQVASEYQGFVLDLYDIYVYIHMCCWDTHYINIKSLFPLTSSFVNRHGALCSCTHSHSRL